jgi:membrane protease YdiL (CAAX protease family)
MNSKFLDLARLGKNNWWRYVLGLLVMVILWLGVTTFFFVVLGAWVFLDNNPETYVERTTGLIKGIDPFINYIALNTGHLALLLGLFLAVRLIHGRSLRTLITPARKINWRLIGIGFGLYFVLLAVFTLVDYLRDPSVYQITQDPKRLLLQIPIVMILTPIQTTTEELVFRGYVLQGIGMLSRRFSIPAFASALVFTAPHMANPELAHGYWPVTLYYFGIGLLLALITLRSNSLELAIGAHASVNLFSALIVNYSDSALSTESIFFCTEIEPVYTLLSFVAVAVIFYYLLFGLKLAERFGGRGEESTVPPTR